MNTSKLIPVAVLALGVPVLPGQLFDWLNPPVAPPPVATTWNNLQCGDTYANATYLTRDQIWYLQSGQYRFWSDMGQPYCRVLRSDSASEFYYFPTAFKSNLGVIVESDSQAVLLSWDFSIDQAPIAPERITAPVVYAEQPPPPPPEQTAVDCVPYP